MEQIPNVRRILARNPQFLAHLFMVILGEGLRGFHAQAVQVEIPGIFPTLKEPLCFDGSLGADRHQRQADYVCPVRPGARKEIRDAKLAAFLLSRKGEAEEFLGLRGDSRKAASFASLISL